MLFVLLVLGFLHPLLVAASVSRGAALTLTKVALDTTETPLSAMSQGLTVANENILVLYICISTYFYLFIHSLNERSDLEPSLMQFYSQP